MLLLLPKDHQIMSIHCTCIYSFFFYMTEHFSCYFLFYFIYFLIKIKNSSFYDQIKSIKRIAFVPGLVGDPRSCTYVREKRSRARHGRELPTIPIAKRQPKSFLSLTAELIIFPFTSHRVIFFPVANH
jgi:hypothetical protein